MTTPRRPPAPRYLALIGSGLLYVALQPAWGQPAIELYKQCRDKPTTVQQRDCFPAAVQQSESELAAAEKDARADLEELEAVSPGSRSLHPVQAFDEAARAFRAFREAERQRVLTSYGSGNGGGVAAAETVIRMNLERSDALAEETATR